jgi:hypothetical protein
VTRDVDRSVTRAVPSAPWYLHPGITGAHKWCLQDVVDDLAAEDAELSIYAAAEFRAHLDREGLWPHNKGHG